MYLCQSSNLQNQRLSCDLEKQAIERKIIWKNFAKAVIWKDTGIWEMLL